MSLRVVLVVVLVSALAVLLAAPAQAESVFLVVAVGPGGQGPGTFQQYGGAPTAATTVPGQEMYQVYRWADVSGTRPGPLSMNVMSTIPQGSISVGSEYFLFGDLPPGSSSLGVSTPPSEQGPPVPIPNDFENAVINGLQALGLGALDPALQALGGTATVSASAFWNHFVNFQQGIPQDAIQQPPTFFSDVDFADFVNQSGEYIGFETVSEFVFGINDDDFSGFTGPTLLGVTRTVVSQSGVLNPGGSGSFTAAPEPSGLALLACGVVLLVRRRRKAA